MKKIRFIDLRIVSMLMIVLIMAACGQAKKADTPAETPAAPQVSKEAQEYVGTYKTNDKTCPIEIVITSQNNKYHYKITTSSKEQEGNVDVTKSDNEVYFDFIGLHGSDKKANISGQYMDKKIVIQNDGNSMNAYTNFSECDMKFIELSKSDAK